MPKIEDIVKEFQGRWTVAMVHPLLEYKKTGLLVPVTVSPRI